MSLPHPITTQAHISPLHSQGPGCSCAGQPHLGAVALRSRLHPPPLLPHPPSLSHSLSLRQPQPASLSSCLSPPASANPGCAELLPAGSELLPRRDPSLTSPCWDAATFPAKHCLPWLYYVCLRRSPASRGRQRRRRRRETGSQSQDKEKAGRQRLAKGST